MNMEVEKSDLVDFPTPEKIAIDIERMVTPGVTYISAVVEYCDKFNYEIEDLCKQLPSALVAKIEAEATDLNLIKDKSGTKIA